MTLYFSAILADIDHSEAARRFSNRELAAYHFYNKRGLVQGWYDVWERIRTEHGTPACAAFGPGGVHYDELHRLAQLKRVHTLQLTATLRCVRRAVRRAEQFLAGED